MTRSLHIDLDLTVDNDADESKIADAVLAVLWGVLDPAIDLPGVWSVDGAEPIRQR